MARNSLALGILALGLWSAKPAPAADWDIFGWFNNGSQGAAPVGDLPPDIAKLRHFPTLVAELEQFYANMMLLHQLAEATGLKVNPEDMLWQELLEGKVIRQFRAKRALSVVVAGGTKTGKSSTTNALAGQVISEVSHISGATKQVVLTVPPSLNDAQLLYSLFPDFELITRWNPADATRDTGTKTQLLVRSIQGMPEDIMFIDTPDVDSTNRTNWTKAYKVAHTADVILAVISPEKHGDDAITEFFAQVATESKKPVVVIINKVQPDQIAEKQWADWLRVFCDKTGIRPFQAYVVPYSSSQLAREGKQQFLKVQGDLSHPENAAAFSLAAQASNLRAELSELNIDRLKAQAQLGSLMMALEGRGGIQNYLELIRRRSDVYRGVLAQVKDPSRSLTQSWPTPPGPIIVKNVSEWWDQNHRYAITHGAVQLMDWISLTWLGKSKRELELNVVERTYQIDQERAIDRAVGQLLASFDPLLDPTGSYLSPQSKAMFSQSAQAKLKQDLKAWYAQHHNVARDFGVVATEVLPKWGEEHPWSMGTTQVLDVLGNGILRPLVTIGTSVASICTSAGTYAPQKVIQHALTNLVESGVVAGGSGVITGKVSEAVGEAAAGTGIPLLFQQLSVGYSALQLQALNEWLMTQHLAPLIAELERGEKLDTGKEFASVAACRDAIATWGRALEQQLNARLIQ